MFNYTLIKKDEKQRLEDTISRQADSLKKNFDEKLELERALSFQKQEAEESRRNIETLKNEANDLKDALVKKDLIISEKDSALSDVGMQLVDIQKKLSEASAEITMLKLDKAEAESKLEKCKKELSKKTTLLEKADKRIENFSDPCVDEFVTVKAETSDVTPTAEETVEKASEVVPETKVEVKPIIVTKIESLDAQPETKEMKEKTAPAKKPEAKKKPSTATKKPAANSRKPAAKRS